MVYMNKRSYIHLMEDNMTAQISKEKEEILEKIRDGQENLEDLEKLSNLFKSVADLTRVRILFVIKDRELCVYDISSVLGMTQSAVSHQLKLLRLSNLVKSRKDGKEVYYSLSDDHVKYLFTIGLDHVRE